MALQKAALAIRFEGGIETKMDRKAVPATRLLVAENAVFTKAVSLVKRNGYEDVGLAIDGSVATISGATRTGVRDDELIAFTSNRAYSLDAEADRWVDSGPVYSVVDTDKPAVRTGTKQTMPDHATAGGITVYAWEDSTGGVWWTAVSSTTDRVYRGPEQLDAGGSRPRCCPCGDVLHVYWMNSTQIKLVVVNPASPSAAPTPIVLTGDLNNGNPTYDAEPTTYAGKPVLMVWPLVGGNSVRIVFVHPSGVIGGPATGLPNGYVESTQTITGLAACATWKSGGAAKLALAACTADFVYVFYYQLVTASGVTSMSLISSSHPLGGGGTGIGTACQRLAMTMTDAADAGTGEQPIYVAAEASAAQPSERFTRIGSVNLTTPVSPILLSVGLASRGFQVSGEPFAMFVHDTTYFNTYFARRLTDGFVVGRLLPALASGAPTRKHLSSVHVTGAVAAVTLSYKERLLSENHDKFTEEGIRYLSLDFASSASHQSAQLGRGLYMGGACPMHYDGKLWNEQGFHVGPELITASSDAIAGGLTAGGKYEYVAWYEWPDAQGEIHLGPTSIGTVITIGGGDKEVTLTLPSLRITAKSNVRVCVARCVANDPSAFYRVTSSDPSTAGQVNGFVANDPTIDELSFTDQMSDAVLLTQEPLYTNGGILSDDPVGLGASIAVGKSRLFFTDASDPNIVHYSQEIDVGYGAELPPELQMRCDPYGGAITALAVMDEEVVIFKEHALYSFSGDGPLPNGDSSQTGFSTPALITSDVGCTDPQSIVLTPQGLMFKSAKGIYLLDRGRQLSYVGSMVEAYNAQAVRRATMMQDRPQVVFLTDSGATLLYDYFFGMWATFTNHNGYDAAISQGRYHYLRTDGRVFRETPGLYSDAGRSISMRLETAWIKMQPHLQGFARFYHLHILGEQKSPHQLFVQYRTDYNPHWSEPLALDATGQSTGLWIGSGGQAWAPTNDPTVTGSQYGDGNFGDGPYGGTPPDAYQWRMHLGEVGQAIQFRFYDYEASAIAGPAFEITELLITGGVKGPARKPFPASRST